MVTSPPLPDLAAPPPAVWNDDRDDTLRCVLVRQETHDVRTFVLAANAPRSFRYLPGQFITLELEIGGQKINRCYTLSSTPTRPDLVSITVKRVPGGPVSNWLHDHLRVGMTLSAIGPAGEFSCFRHAPAKSYLFLSGGSGITPLMSMTRALHDLGSEADIVFVHCARTPADLLFPEELTLMARNLPKLRLAMVCEQHTAGSAYAGHLGRMDAARLAHIAPDFLQRDTYTCGPAPFMGAVRQILAGAGYDMARYREESFSFEAPADTSAPPAEAAPADAAAGEAAHTVTLQNSGQSFACRSDQTILQAAQAAGVRMPSSCSNGVCGTCKTRKAAGEVQMQHNGGIRPREVAQGWILPCCSKPLGDIALER